MRIFLGYAPGVGTTLAMLEAAQGEETDGTSILAVGIMAHGQPEGEAILQTMEAIPGRYPGLRDDLPPDMDVDQVLARHPHLVLVKDLAHRNRPGARHPHRFQDVEDLLDSGIHVFATLHIHRLESLNDVVFQITGIRVRETVPDRILDRAEEIQLVDMPVADLRQRYQQGKVHLPGPSIRGMDPFFRPGNLTALRELAFHQAARRVDAQMRAYMQSHAISGPWPAGERVLVCVGPSPLSRRLVRAARRLADNLRAEWLAVHIETPSQAYLSPAEQERVASTLRLAEDLGAKALTIPGTSVAEAVAAFAQSHNITKIVVGKPLRSRWQEWLRSSLVDQIIHHSREVDIYIIHSNEPAATPESKTRPTVKVKWQPIAQSLLLVATTTLLALPLRGRIEPANLVMVYLLAVVIASVLWGRGAAVLTSLAGVVAFDLLLIPPYHTLGVSDAEYFLTFAGLLVVGLVISTLSARSREQVHAAMHRENQTNVLYEFSRDLTVAAHMADVAATVAVHLERALSVQVDLWLPQNGRIVPFDPTAPLPPAMDREAVEWVFHRGQMAGRGTDTFSEAHGCYLPLAQREQVLGVLGVRLDQAQAGLSRAQQRLLESFANQAALAVDRVQLADAARQAQLVLETEQLQTALLNSVSHDLRTPLATITGTLSSLLDEDVLLNAEIRQELVETAWEESERLNRLVGNLLDMTRLEAGALRIAQEWCDAQDLIGVSLSRMVRQLRDRPVVLDIQDNLPLLPIDMVLMTQVMVNLLENALKYSPTGSAVEIGVRQQHNALQIRVSDRGTGIAGEDTAWVFEKFRRGVHAGISGTGLGLSIAKGIVEAHRGSIQAENRPDGGATVVILLPVNGSPPLTQSPTQPRTQPPAFPPRASDGDVRS